MEATIYAWWRNLYDSASDASDHEHHDAWGCYTDTVVSCKEDQQE